jgi:hypothetical protein
MIMTGTISTLLHQRLVQIPVVLSICMAPLFAQAQPAAHYAATIQASDLKSHLTVLASDSLEGRGTASPGQYKAAEYIRGIFKKNGVSAITGQDDSAYLQLFRLMKPERKDALLSNCTEPTADQQNILFSGVYTDRLDTCIHAVFAGYGDDTSLARAKIQGKAAIAIIKSGGHHQFFSRALAAGAVMPVALYENVAHIENLKWIMDMNAAHDQMTLPSALDTQRYGFIVPVGLAEDWYGTKISTLIKAAGSATGSLHASRKALQPLVLQMKVAENVDTMIAANVMGWIPGTDLRHEAIVISAHYDHLGHQDGAVYYGADDNASGTSAVLEIAQAFATAKANGSGPRRSIIFVLFSAEEKGLLGSQYYVQHAPVPLANTVANLNIDMIGRVDHRHREDSSYVYLIGSDKISTELHELSEQVNEEFVGLSLDYTYNYDDDPNRYYYRSDHFNFAKNQVPVIFYFNGPHADYHEPSDTADKINYEILSKRARLIFHTAWALANRDKRPAPHTARP